MGSGISLRFSRVRLRADVLSPGGVLAVYPIIPSCVSVDAKRRPTEDGAHWEIAVMSVRIHIRLRLHLLLHCVGRGVRPCMQISSNAVSATRTCPRDIPESPASGDPARVPNQRWAPGCRLDATDCARETPRESVRDETRSSMPGWRLRGIANRIDAIFHRYKSCEPFEAAKWLTVKPIIAILRYDFRLQL